jgi:hypothetical protein
MSAGKIFLQLRQFRLLSQEVQRNGQGVHMPALMIVCSEQTHNAFLTINVGLHITQVVAVQVKQLSGQIAQLAPL